ncbi:hypothetical protein Tco_0737883 [Tanacetum coccineum]
MALVLMIAPRSANAKIHLHPGKFTRTGEPFSGGLQVFWGYLEEKLPRILTGSGTGAVLCEQKVHLSLLSPGIGFYYEEVGIGGP